MSQNEAATISEDRFVKPEQTSLPFGNLTIKERQMDEYVVQNSSLIRRILCSDGSYATSSQKIDGSNFEELPEDKFDKAWLMTERPPELSGRRGEVRIADLFSGCGGISLGLMEACRALEYRPKYVFSCEMEKIYADVYAANFRPEHRFDGPIQTAFDGEVGSGVTRTEKEWQQRIGALTIAVGGPPCQGHSDLNNHTRRDDPRNSLYMKMARFAEIVEPEHLIIENVLGVRHDSGGVFDRTVETLLKLGYSVDTPLLKAERLGVPQRRHRAFIIASKTKALHQGFFDDVFGSEVVASRTVGWACDDLLDVEQSNPMDQASNLTNVSRERVNWMYDNNVHDLPDEMRPSCHRDKDHTYKSVYGRLYWDKPAWTITTGFLVMGQGRFLHPLRRRVITPREAARLQFFPDFFDFGNQKRSGYAKMIGNAVPSKMAYSVAIELLK